MPIAAKIKKVLETGTYYSRIAAKSTELKQKYGIDKVFDLSVSNPVLEPPAEFSNQLQNFVESPINGKHRYMENAGYTANRIDVANQLKKETGINFSLNEVIMTCGAAGALNIIFKAIFNPGEELLAFAPVYPEYLSYVENYFGVCQVLPADSSFIPDFKALETAITPRTKAVIINSPNNPTGTLYSEKTLKLLADIVAGKGAEFNTTIYIISDETYSRLCYDGVQCPRMFNFYPNTIALTSYSADLCIPGERGGYTAVHPACQGGKEVFGAMIHANRTLGFINMPAIVQNVIHYLPDTSMYLASYQRKRDFLYNRLTQMGYSMIKPQGGLFMFPRTPIKDDQAFAEELQKHLVLAIPGSEFNTPGYLRVSFAVENSTLEGSLSGFQKAIRQYNK